MLVILAAVTLNSIFGSNIIGLATNGAINYTEEQQKELGMLNDVSDMLGDITGDTDRPMSPTITLSGTKGNNDIYTSNVMVTISINKGLEQTGTIKLHYKINDGDEQITEEDVSFEVDFRRWEEYGDEVIYRNGKLTIELSNLDESVGRYRIFFRFRGIYSRDSATLVSWRNYGVDQSHNGEWKQTAELFCDYNGESRSCKLAGFSYLNYKDGETMGFFVPETITPATRVGVVQFRLHNLTMSRWERREDISVGG